jgi:hypothetical protein
MAARSPPASTAVTHSGNRLQNSPRARSPVPIAIGAILARLWKAVAATAPYVTGVTDWPENPIQHGRAG